MATFAFSVEKMTKYDLGADGAMGTTNPESFTDIKEGTTTIAFPEPQFTDIKAEDIPGTRVSLPQEGDAPNIVFESIDISNEQMVKFFGGTIATGTYTPPAGGFATPEGSFEVITKPLAGKKTTWKFPRVMFSPSMDSTLQKTDVVSIKMTVKILTPTDATGEALPLFTKTEAAA